MARAPVTQTNWTINVAARHAPRVIIDESHGKSDTIDPAAANQLNSQHPDSTLFGRLTQAMLSLAFKFRGLPRTNHRAGPEWCGYVGIRPSYKSSNRAGNPGHLHLGTSRWIFGVPRRGVHQDLSINNLMSPWDVTVR